MSVIAYFQQDIVFFTFTIFLLGLCIGSFLNVVIYRLPVMEEREWQDAIAESQNQPPSDKPRISLMWPRSRCPQCGHMITALENIPVLSYLFLLGRCSGCHTHISLRYPLIELLTAVLSATIAWKFGCTWQTMGFLILVWSLISLSFIDFDTQMLPDAITLPLVWCGLLFNLNGVFVPLHTAVIGAMAGYLSLWSVFWLYYGVKTLTNWLYKRDDPKEGMGFGDFKLLAALGAFLGWKAVPVIILLSSVVGACIGIGMIVALRHDRRVPIPFGPYIAIAGMLTLFIGDPLIKLIISF